jgi:hypothetical protein
MNILALSLFLLTIPVIPFEAFSQRLSRELNLGFPVNQFRELDIHDRLHSLAVGRTFGCKSVLTNKGGEINEINVVRHLFIAFTEYGFLLSETRNNKQRRRHR